MNIKLLAIICFSFLDELKGEQGENNLCKGFCPSNEIFTQCSLGQFQSTCWNSRKLQFFHICELGCACQEGFIRHPDTYECIPFNECPPKPDVSSHICPKNEKWDRCGYGCDQTCGLHFRDFTCRSCFPGCVCQKNYVRSSINGQCILDSECKNCPRGYFLDPRAKLCSFCNNGCSENEFYNECGSRCEKTCENPSGAGVDCDTCKPRCECIFGLLRDLKTNDCVKPQECT
ncbi:CLUMA_CG017052, isoform A [Clunio marinus]|uniref:CLUMA_CG017052, isoform A n=1 Tax=Clunio marinus TaxID=568069 RepID=A0A1J1IUJ3_9DIPT|nr:CLUMA_CG017052, isoform A [Clunio marinus]